MYGDKDSNRIIIGGFGQGCSLVSATFLNLPGTTPYGGIICIAGLNPLAIIPTPTNPSLKVTKYFILAGKKDERVWYLDTKRSINQRLDSLIYNGGYRQNKKFYTTNYGHEISTFYKITIQSHLYEQNVKFDKKPTGWTLSSGGAT